jgi:dipeptidyl aminopeptidase/acylaminoacyl peptidase
MTPEPMSLVTGASLGPYQILAPLGAGGMGEVYRACDRKLNRDVALKVLPEIFTADPERVARFQREAQLLASLNHPNIGAIYGLEGQDGRPVSLASAARQLAVADRAGVTRSLMVPVGPYGHVRASRDGKYVALGSDDGKEAIVWIYELSGTSAIRRLTLEGRNQFPIWSPDGQRVAFQSDREGDLAIFAMRADGTGAMERLTRPEKGQVHVPGSWAPDGKHLVFSVRSEASGFSLWTLSVDDKKAAPYGNAESSEPMEPVFSPDGRWIAYASAPGGGSGFSANRGVYLQPFPVTGARYQVPKQALDFHPLWSPRGGELFFTPSSASGRLAAVRVSMQPSVTLGAAESFPAKVTADRLSGDMRAFDILPDGRFIGLTNGSGPESAQASQLRIVLNWTEELKQRMPVK